MMLKKIPTVKSSRISATRPVVSLPSVRGNGIRRVLTRSSKSQASPLIDGIQFHDNAWGKIETEEQFFATLEGNLKSFPSGDKLLLLWHDFYNNYRNAVLNSKVPGANEQLVAKVQASIADNVMLQFADPYTFPSYHERMITELYSYFDFGQRYVASLTNFNESVLGYRERWDKAQQQLDAGENVILLANHQTEADPGVFAHMLMSTHPKMATDVVYIAGDRVVTDPMCKPFSMGRNLYCVHSKKHIDDIPELKASKMETNRKTLLTMQRALNQGGRLIWVAPSGGRDRPNQSDEYIPDSFDPTAVELMRSLSARAKKPGHIYPMAMFSWPMMPPPRTIDKNIGERRITNFTPVGISLCEELDVSKVLSGINVEDKEQQQRALAKYAHEQVVREFKQMSEAINDKSKRGPGTPYSQPWFQDETYRKYLAVNGVVEDSGTPFVVGATSG